MIARLIGFSASATTWLTLVSNALAQTSTPSAGKGGTSGALPDAGSTELTYLIFLGGLILFVIGTLKLILSFRES